MSYKKISEGPKKMTTVSFGNVKYNLNEEINEDDLLRLEYARKIEFDNKFNQSIDELPDNITEIILGNCFVQKINKIPKKLRYFQVHNYCGCDELFDNNNLKKISIKSCPFNQRLYLQNICSENMEELEILCSDILYCNFNNFTDKLKTINISIETRIIGNRIDVPNKTKNIKLSSTRKKYKIITFLPSSLKTLDDNVFILNNNSMALPNSLETLKFDTIQQVMKLGKNINTVEIIKFFRFTFKIRHVLTSLIIKSGQNNLDNEYTLLKFYEPPKIQLQDSIPNPFANIPNANIIHRNPNANIIHRNVNVNVNANTYSEFSQKKFEKIQLTDLNIIIENINFKNIKIEHFLATCDKIKVKNNIYTNKFNLYNAHRFNTNNISADIKDLTCEVLMIDQKFINNSLRTPIVLNNFTDSNNLQADISPERIKFIKDILHASSMANLSTNEISDHFVYKKIELPRCLFRGGSIIPSIENEESNKIRLIERAANNQEDRNVIQIYSRNDEFNEYIDKKLKEDNIKITHELDFPENIDFNKKIIVMYVNLLECIDVKKRLKKIINMEALNLYLEKIKNVVNVIKSSNSKYTSFIVLTNGASISSCIGTLNGYSNTFVKIKEIMDGELKENMFIKGNSYIL